MAPPREFPRPPSPPRGLLRSPGRRSRSRSSTTSTTTTITTSHQRPPRQGLGSRRTRRLPCPLSRSHVSCRSRSPRLAGLRQYQHRFAHFLAVVNNFPRLSDPDSLEARGLLLHVALGMLLVMRDLRTSRRLAERFMREGQSISSDWLEHELMKGLVDHLVVTEDRLAARTVERSEGSEEASHGVHRDVDDSARVPPHVVATPLGRHQHPRTLAGVPAEHHHPPGVASSRSQEPPVAPEHLLERRMAQYQRTIQQLVQVQELRPQDLSGQLVYLHVALAQLHLLQHDPRLSPLRPRHSFEQQVTCLKAGVLEEVYLCEEDLGAESHP